jgi:Tol biopolymer transport system component
MKSLTSLLSILALGFGLFGCAAKEEVPIANTGAAAPYGVVGIAYAETLTTTCSSVPLPWTLSSGTLPAGIAFNGATGEVAGIPNAAGNYTVIFAGKDSTGTTMTCAVSFVVRPRTDRVSVDTFGNSVDGVTNREPSISSADGRFIAVTSIPSFTGLSLIAGVTGQQIYLHDRQTGQPSLISKDNFGTAGIGGASSAASISADGRFIAFVSIATNLAPGVSGQQIYLHDRQTSQTSLVSKASDGTAGTGGVSSAPSISADGNFVAFVSTAPNLVAGVIGQQVYLYNRQANQLSLVSKDSVGVAGTGGISSAPSVSADGNVVAFVSTATNLVNPSVSGQQIYRHDRQTGQTSLISRDSGGIAGTGGISSAPSVSADGNVVAFVSTATNLVNPTVSGQQIYRHDRQTGQTSLISRDSGGIAGTGGISSAPSISADGNVVAFVSTATNLVTGVTGQQIYLHDRQPVPTGQTRVVSKDELGTPIPVSNTNPSPAPVITGNGAFVVFVSSAANLVTSPPPAAAFDVYVRAIP